MLALGAFGAGLLAGLAIALPLGAIGVLIVREGVEQGLRAASVAALAVATVDFTYALVAVLAGDRLSEWLVGYRRLIEVVGALVLGAVVIHGLAGLREGRAEPGAAGGDAPLDRPGIDVPAVPTHRVFLRFLGLTALNPMTAVYFVALTVGLSEVLGGTGSGAAFAGGVFLGSLAWQLVLAFTGSAAGAVLSDRFRIVVSLAGYGIVAMYALRLGLGA